MIKVAAFTGGVNTPSARFRIRQYIWRLAAHGVVIEEHLPFFEKSCGLPSPFKAAARSPGLFRSRNADIVWIGKELVKGYKTFEGLLRHPRIMDVDDAIWLSFPFGKFAAPAIARTMDAIVAGNSYLADHFSQYCKTIYIIPTAIDTERYQLRDLSSAEPPDKFVIGWTGLACNYKFLKTISPVLKQFLADHERAELLLVSNRDWKQNVLPADRIKFIPWSMENEARVLHSMSVGIMPLTDDKWTRGKCSFKMLQYMAAGLPVITSPVGMNAQVLDKGRIGFGVNSPDEWYDALKTLYNDWSLQVSMGKAGRDVVQQFYNADIAAKELAEIFKTLAG